MTPASWARYDNTGGPRGQLAAHPAVAQFLLDNAANVERAMDRNLQTRKKTVRLEDHPSWAMNKSLVVKGI